MSRAESTMHRLLLGWQFCCEVSSSALVCTKFSCLLIPESSVLFLETSSTAHLSCSIEVYSIVLRCHNCTRPGFTLFSTIVSG